MQERENLKCFLYLLMRDVAPTGEVVDAIMHVEELDRGAKNIYTAEPLAEYAQQLADRILTAGVVTEEDSGEEDPEEVMTLPGGRSPQFEPGHRVAKKGEPHSGRVQSVSHDGEFCYLVKWDNGPTTRHPEGDLVHEELPGHYP